MLRESRSNVACFACLIGLVALAPGAAAAPAAASGCAPAGAKILASSGASRLYSNAGQLYGCLSARSTRLGVVTTAGHLAGARVVHFALAGRYAALDTATMGIDRIYSTLSVVDLQTGRQTAHAPATSPATRAESFITASSLVLDSHGTAAWIGTRGAIGMPTPIREVRELSPAGDRLLATGTAIKPASLRLAGQTLSWVDGTKTHHSPLSP